MSRSSERPTGTLCSRVPAKRAPNCAKWLQVSRASASRDPEPFGETSPRESFRELLGPGSRGVYPRAAHRADPGARPGHEGSSGGRPVNNRELTGSGSRIARHCTPGITAAGARASPRHSRSAPAPPHANAPRNPLRKSVSVPNLPSDSGYSQLQNEATARRTRARAPLHLRRPGRDGGERDRDDHVVAGEREPEEAPGRLVAAHHRDRLQLVEEAAGGAEIVERARAFLRARPKLPLNPVEAMFGSGATCQTTHSISRADVSWSDVRALP